MDNTRKNSQEKLEQGDSNKTDIVMHQRQEDSRDRAMPMHRSAAAAARDTEMGSPNIAPRIQPVPTAPLSASKTSSSCPFQSLRRGITSASGTQKLRSCLRIAPAGSPESEQAAHLLASLKQKDEDALRKEKRKMRNRLAAAKSNERRREKLEAQKKELEDLKKRLHTLKSKQVVVELENEKLKSTLRDKQKEGDGASSSAMSDISHGQ